MKISHGRFGILIILAFLLGTWFSSRLFPPSGNSVIAGGGLPPSLPADRQSPKQHLPSNNVTVLPVQGKLPINPRLVEFPISPDSNRGGVVHNTGPYIDPDFYKSTAQSVDREQPVRNTGVYVEPVGPPPSVRGAMGAARN
jgi:hypothetical protein